MIPIWLCGVSLAGDLHATIVEHLKAGNAKGALAELVRVDPASVPDLACLAAMASYRLDQILVGDLYAESCDRTGSSSFGAWSVVLVEEREAAREDLARWAIHYCSKSTCASCAKQPTTGEDR